MELFDCETGEKISGTYVSIEPTIELFKGGCSRDYERKELKENFRLYLNWDTYIAGIKEAFKDGFSNSDVADIDVVYPVALFAEKSKNCPLEKLREKQPILVCNGILRSSTSVKNGYIPEKLLKSKFKKTFEIFKEMGNLERKLNS